MGEPQLVNTWAISKLDAAVYSRAFHRRTKGTDELDELHHSRPLGTREKIFLVGSVFTDELANLVVPHPALHKRCIPGLQYGIDMILY